MHFLADTLDKGKSWDLLLSTMFGLAQITHHQLWLTGPRALPGGECKWAEQRSETQHDMKPCFWRLHLVPSLSLFFLLPASCEVWGKQLLSDAPSCCQDVLNLFRPLVMEQANQGVDWGLWNRAEIKSSPSSYLFRLFFSLWQKWCSIQKENNRCLLCWDIRESPPNIHSSLSSTWTQCHIKLTNNSNEKYDITSLQAWLAVALSSGI